MSEKLEKLETLTMELAKKLDPEIISCLLIPIDAATTTTNGGGSVVKIPLSIVHLISQYRVSCHELGQRFFELDLKAEGVEQHIRYAEEVESTWLKDLLPFLQDSDSNLKFAAFGYAHKLGIGLHALDQYAVSGFYSYIAKQMGLNVVKIIHDDLRNFELFAKSLGYWRRLRYNYENAKKEDYHPLIWKAIDHLGLTYVMPPSIVGYNHLKVMEIATSWGNTNAQYYGAEFLTASPNLSLKNQGIDLHRMSMRQGCRASAARILDYDASDVEAQEHFAFAPVSDKKNYVDRLMQLYRILRNRAPQQTNSAIILAQDARHLRAAADASWNTTNVEPLTEIIDNWMHGTYGFPRDPIAAKNYLTTILTKCNKTDNSAKISIEIAERAKIILESISSG